MSKIGKKPIKIPEGVKIEIDGERIKVSGPKGELEKILHPKIKLEVKEGELLVSPSQKLLKKEKGLWGLYKVLISNMIEGVTKGFEKKLEIEGVGFRAYSEGDYLVLNLGFTHPVKIRRPHDINFAVEKNVITVSGIDKEKVGQIAAEIRMQKKAEPYKGKGIKYLGERIRRKEGKKVIASK